MLLESLDTPDKQLSSSLSRKDGITPLIMSAAMNHDQCVDVLLCFGTDPNQESKASLVGKTVLNPDDVFFSAHCRSDQRLYFTPVFEVI